MTLHRIAPLVIAVVAVAACGDKQSAGPDAVAGPASKAATATAGTPKFRPGLWEFTDNAAGETQTRQECKEVADEDPGLSAFEDLPAGCTLDRQPRPGGIRIVATCDEDGTKVVQRLDMSGSDTNLTLNMQMTMQAGSEAPVVMHTVESKAKWIGPCPVAR